MQSEIDILTQALETLFRIKKMEDCNVTDDVCDAIKGLAGMVGAYQAKSAEEVIDELEEQQKEKKRIAAEKTAKWEKTEDYKLFINDIRKRFDKKK